MGSIPDLEGAEALKVLKPLDEETDLKWHPVSRDVGKVSNHGKELPYPVQLDKTGLAQDEKNKKASNFMQAWLGGKKSKKEEEDEDENEDDDDDDDEPEEKRAKANKD